MQARQEAAMIYEVHPAKIPRLGLEEWALELLVKGEPVEEIRWACHKLLLVHVERALNVKDFSHQTAIIAANKHWMDQRVEKAIQAAEEAWPTA